MFFVGKNFADAITKKSTFFFRQPKKASKKFIRINSILHKLKEDMVGVAKDMVEVVEDMVGVAKGMVEVVEDMVGVAKDMVGVAEDMVGVAKDMVEVAEDMVVVVVVTDDVTNIIDKHAYDGE